MLNMKTFRKLLVDPSNQDPYLKALIALTKVSPSQLTAMSSDLVWQAW